MKKEVWTKAYLPNDTALLSDTITDGVYKEQQGQLSAKLENRVLHGYLKWRPELIKEATVISSNLLTVYISRG